MSGKHEDFVRDEVLRSFSTVGLPISYQLFWKALDVGMIANLNSEQNFLGVVVGVRIGKLE